MQTDNQNRNKLAQFGGTPCINTRSPHEVWPPPPTTEELDEICSQRRRDISIKGRSSIIREFEEQFLCFLEGHRKYAVTFNSGTSALFAAYFALGVTEDDEVVGPALTFHAALSPAYTLRANVVLVDIDVNTRCIDVNRIEEAITGKTRVITVVHQWGHPADMDRVMEIARKHKLYVIEDCSHAHGSRYKSKPVGTFGDVAVFSLQAAKMIYAGEGGILVTNSESVHDQATLLGHYRDRSRDEIKDPLRQSYWVTGYGQKFRMSPLNAVVAKHSLRHFPERKRQRHLALEYLSSQLKHFSFLSIPSRSTDIDMGAWYGFKPLYNPEALHGISIEVFLRALQAEGLEISMASAPVLATQPLYSSERNPLFPNHKGRKIAKRFSLKNAELVQERSLSLPTFNSWPNDKALIDLYVTAFEKVQKNAGALYEYYEGGKQQKIDDQQQSESRLAAN